MNEETASNREAVALAYEWLPGLYETAEQRYIAADNRIQWVLGFSVTLFVSVGAFLRIINASIVFNGAFWFTMGVMGLQVVLGLVALAVGSIKSFGLHSVIQNGLGFTADEFKSHALGWADSDIAGTTTSINWKGWAVWILVVGLVLEAASLFIWITTLSSTSASAP